MRLGHKIGVREMKITLRLEALTRGEKEALGQIADKGPGRLCWLPTDPIFDPGRLDRANWTIPEREAASLLPAEIAEIIHRLRRSKGWAICPIESGEWGINTRSPHTLRRAGLDPHAWPWHVHGAGFFAVVTSKEWRNIWGLVVITPQALAPAGE